MDESPTQNNPEPQQTMTAVVCGNCKAQFEFPTQGISAFGFTCTNCGSHNHVDL